ncbi:peptidylprolyl isomerase [Agathobaculum hominis]|uniref:Peptidylprolyl isomerase n=1 Tax=Agathobaculum hominis TaxID=2763014 RepID=A0ABR7GLS6_9FIRM|nr:peptidylprolyl isomerase [Agathobaculum hominis]MBC5695270.1 peptidylprolyl isomerase [Agathobaculum hominis]
MSKLVQRLAAMVAMTAVVLGATIGGVSSMMIHYKPLNEGAETVLTVNGDAVTADEYSGYMLYNMQYYASMYAQMGLTDLWSNEDMAKSLGASMPEAAEQQAIYARVVMQKFNELGLKLSYNEQKEMASVRRNSIANTTKDAYLNQIAQFGFSDQTYQNFMYISQCYQALNDYYFGENGVNTPSDEDIQKYYEDNYITAKHILITTVDPASGETKRTDEEAKKEAQSILDRINAGEDFDTLMNQYSEDTGLSNNPNGYTFTEGQMVTEFYDGAKALAEDEVSELVKSSYGYHIIKRVKLDDSQLDNFKSDIISAISGSMDELLQQWMDEAQVETTDLYSTITYENVYDYLPQDVQTLVTRPGEASEQSDAQQSDAQPSDAEQSATEQSAQ